MKVRGVKKTQNYVKKKSRNIVSEGKHRVSKHVLTDLKRETPVDTGRARDGWKIVGSKIINNVPYISYLNKGSSLQAPSHFVEKTAIRRTHVHPNGTIVTNTLSE